MRTQNNLSLKNMLKPNQAWSTLLSGKKGGTKIKIFFFFLNQGESEVVAGVISQSSPFLMGKIKSTLKRYCY